MLKCSIFHWLFYARKGPFSCTCWKNSILRTQGGKNLDSCGLSNFAKNITFPFRSREGMWHFRPGCGEIVYYAPREKKTWAIHSSCKLTPEPKARVANTSCGLTNFTPVERILFFLTSRQKMPYFRFGARRKWGTFGPVLGKYFFCPPAGKCQLSGRCAKRSCRFPAPSSRKIVYGPWPVKKKASDHMFVNLSFASADNYMWSETFLILQTLCRNILFIYCF